MPVRYEVIILVIFAVALSVVSIRYLVTIESRGRHPLTQQQYTRAALNTSPDPLANRSQALPNMLEVTHPASASAHLSFFDKTITDADAVQRLYSATLRLPREDSNVKLCMFNPMIIANELRFFKDDEPILHATLVVGGCGSWVKIDGFDRDLAPDDSYFSLLRKSLGVTDQKLYGP